MDLLEELQFFCRPEHLVVSGYEYLVSGVVEARYRELADSVLVTDNHDILFKLQGDPGLPPVAVTAHLDIPGFMVLSLQDDGFIRMLPSGYFDPRSVYCQRVRVGRNGIPGVVLGHSAHYLDQQDFVKPLAFRDLVVDVGARSLDDLKALGLRIGDQLFFDSPLVPLAGRRVMATGLDNRAMCAAMACFMAAFRQLKGPTLYCCFTAREETSLTGAVVLTKLPEVKRCYILDIMPAGDTPNEAGLHHTVALDRGLGLMVMTEGDPTDIPFLDHTEQVLLRAGVPCQRGIMEGGETEANLLQNLRDDLLVQNINVPCRACHTSGEIVSIADLEACVAGLVACILEPTL